MKDNFIKKYWQENPFVIKEFTENLSMYKQLCFEIEFYVRNLLDKNKIRYASVTSRAKTLNSFIEKTERKKYKNLFEEITDFAGVRIVALYKDEISSIEKLIEKEFEIIEKIDRSNDLEADYFGYEAIHYVLKLGENCKGVRYDNLKKINCEVQVRTILQDAWAIVAHHITYKKEKDIPQALMRKLNRLVGLFETADEQFVSIKNERKKYIDSIELNPSKVLEEEINLDSLTEYLKYKFPELRIGDYDLERIPAAKSFNKYKKIKELDNIINNSEKAINEYKKQMNDPYFAECSTKLLNVALAIHNREYFENSGYSTGFGEIATKIVEEFKKW